MEPKVKILVIEDERDINDLISLQLNREGYDVTQSYDGQDGLMKALNSEFHVVVLDWMLPSINGLEILKKIREQKKSDKMAIIMATAKGHSDDIILGLEHGADDYLSKPYDLNVLKARVKAILRRGPAISQSTQKVLIAGDLELNLVEHTVTCKGAKIDLTISEYKLLSSLMINQGKVLSRKDLILEIQGEGVTVIDRSIDTHMVGLRKKLGLCSDLVKTVRGVGYKIEVLREDS